MKRRSLEAEALEQDYFSELRHALVEHDPILANELLQDAREHLESALAELDGLEVNLEQMQTILEEIGTPQSYVTEAFPVTPTENLNLTPDPQQSPDIPKQSKSKLAYFMMIALLSFILAGPYIFKTPQAPTILLPVQATKISHQGEVSPDKFKTLVLSFNAELNPKLDYQNAIQFIPQVKGKVYLTQSHQLSFECEESLKPAQSYQIILSSDLTSLDGRKIEAKSWQLTTPRPKLLSAKQSRLRIYHQAQIELSFSLPIDPVDLKQHLKVTSPQKDLLEYSLVSSKTSRQHHINIKQSNWTHVSLHISAELASTEGPLSFLKDINKKILLSPKLKLDQVYTSFKNQEAIIRVRMNHSVELNKIKDYVQIQPKLNLNFETHHRGFDILGEFKSGQRYQLSLKPGLPAGAAGELETEVQRVLWFPDQPKSFGFVNQGGYLSPNNQLILPIHSTNLEQLKLKTRKLLPHNLVEWALGYSNYVSSSLVYDQEEKIIHLKNKKNELIETVLPLENYLGAKPKGVYYFELRQSESYRKKSNLITISDLGLSLRKSNSDVLIWVMSLSNNQPVQGVDLKLYDSQRTLLHTLKSDENGLCKTSLNKDQKLALVIAQKGDDMSYLNLNRGQLKRNAPNQNNRPYLSEGYEVFAHSERGIYRPGDDLHLNAYIRDEKWDTPPSFPILIKVLKPSGKELIQQTVTTNEHGMIYAKLNLPDHCSTGQYRVSYSLPSSPSKSLGSHRFLVKDFIPQTLKMEVELDKSKTLFSKTLSSKVSVQHLFGEAASGIKSQADFYFRSQPIQFPTLWKDYLFGDSKQTPKYKKVSFGKRDLDEKGETTFRTNLNLNWDRAQVQVESKVQCLEKGGRALIESDQHTYALWKHYLGIKQSNQQAQNKQAFPLEFIHIDLHGKLQQPKEMTQLEIYKVNYQYVLRKKGRDLLQYIWEKDEELALKQSLNFEEGQSKLMWTPEQAGEYEIRLTNSKAFHARQKLFVQGQGMKWSMQEGASLKIKTDKDIYNIGDRAKVSILAPFDGHALLTIESDRILEEKLVRIKNGQAELDYLVKNHWKPNVYFSATLTRAVQAEEQWHPHRASGIKQIRVNCKDHQLDLQISTPDSVEPGKDLNVSLKVKNKGQAVSNAAITLYAVDMGILNITKYKRPQPFDYFYQTRRLDIHEYDMYQNISPYLKKWTLAKALKPGGGILASGEEFGRHLSQVKAKRVKPAILFESKLISDEQGQVKANFKIPEYIGELKIIAVANHTKNFGSQETTIKVKSDLMVKSSWPRFAAPEDKFDVALTIFNLSDQKGDVSLDFELQGPLQVLKKPDSITLTGNQHQTIWVTCQASQVGVSKVRLVAKMNNQQFSQSIEIPIRPSVKFARQFDSLLLQGEGEHQIQPLGKYIEGSERTQIHLFNSPSIELVQLAQSLLQYPYGCAEQTTSRLVPLIYLHDLMKFIEPELSNRQEIKNKMDAGLQRLNSLQTRSGALSMWPRSSHEEPLVSIYATYVLLEAQKAGWEVPQLLLDNLIDYLEDKLGSWCQYKQNSKYKMLGEAAYASYVLAKAGKVPYSWLGHLENNLKHHPDKSSTIPNSAYYYLAAAQHLAGSPKALQNFTKQALLPQQIRETHAYYQSEIREKAILLSLLLDHEPKASVIQQLASQLRSKTKERLTTQEKAHLIFALGKLSRQQPIHPPKKVQYTTPNGQIQELDLAKGVSLNNVKSQQVLSLKFEGSGNLYASWTSEGVPISGMVKEEDAGLKVRRSIFKADRQILNTHLQQGEIYTIRIQIDSSQTHKNLVISDLLAAGLETESSKFKAKGMSVAFFENRDDRNLIFCDLLKQKAEFEYQVRAVTSGHFQVPALDASCMYDPSIFSIHGKQDIHIQKASP